VEVKGKTIFRTAKTTHPQVFRLPTRQHRYSLRIKDRDVQKIIQVILLNKKKQYEKLISTGNFV